MTSWKKKHLKSSLCISSQTQTHTRSAVQRIFLTIAGRRYYPLLHITNCIFTLSLPSSTCAKCSETTLRPTGQSSGNCFPSKNTELPELSYICLYCDRAGCTSLHIFGDSSCHGGHVFCGYLCWWWSGYNPSHTNAVLALHWNPCQRRASSWQTLAVRGCNKQVKHVGPTSWTTRQSDVRIQFLEATHLESELNPYTVVHSQRLKGTCEQELSCVSAEHVPRYSNYLYDQQLEPYCWWFKPSQNQVVVEGWILDHQQHGDRM